MTEEKKEEVQKEEIKKDEEVKVEQEEVTSEEFEESEEVLVLKNTIEALQEKVKATQAELVNYRKRKDEEVEKRLKFANQDLILELLPIADNFERALKLQNNDPSISKFLDGFKMLYNTLITVLKNYGVEEIEASGKMYDHNLHEAMLVESDPSKEDGIVLEVLIKGYTLKGRVLRPASVKVNKIEK